MDPQRLYFHKHKVQLRIVGYPDASYRNNADLSSQRPQVIFISEPKRNSADAAHAAEGKLADATHAAVKTGPNRASNEDHKHAKGSLIDFESTKIRKTTLSTTVAELYSFMKCYGT